MATVRSSSGGASSPGAHWVAKVRKLGAQSVDTTRVASALPGGISLRSQSAGAPSLGGLFGPIRVLKHAVFDLDAWLEQAVSLGVGPWWVTVGQAPQEFVFRGKQSDARFKWGLTWSGDLMLEIIQPLDEYPSPYLEFLERGRVGTHHAAYYPADFDAAVRELSSQGKSKILYGHSGGARFAYFEGLGSPPEPIELQELPADVLAKHERLKRIANAWRGEEPFRGPPREWW